MTFSAIIPSGTFSTLPIIQGIHSGKSPEKNKIAQPVHQTASSPLKSIQAPSLSLLPLQEKVTRKRYTYESIPENTPLKRTIDISRETALDILSTHARWRPVMFGVTAIAIHSLALRSNPFAVRNVSLNIDQAWLQLGSGTGGLHAAHMNAAPGFVDDIEDQFIREIVTEKGVTPRKARLMHAKGFSSEDIALMEAHDFDLQTITDIFDARWPLPKGKPRSVLNNTLINDTLNLTTPIKSHANLTTDKILENSERREIIRLYHQSIFGIRSVEELTREYCQNVRNHFTRVISELETYGPVLEVYQNLLATLSNEIDNLNTFELRTLLESISVRFKEVLSIKIEKDDQKTSKKVHSSFLSENRKFLKFVAEYLQGPPNYNQVEQYLISNGETLQAEISKRIKHVREYLEEAQSELAGTVDPDMNEIYAQLIKDYEKEPTVEDDDLQYRMLAPKNTGKPKVDIYRFLDGKRKERESTDSDPKRVKVAPVSVAKVLFH